MFDSPDGGAVSKTRMADVLAFIDACQGDLAFLGPIAGHLAKAAPDLVQIKKPKPPRPEIIKFPDISTVAAMQMSFFDNGEDAGTNRFKVQCEFWSGEARRIDLNERDPAKVTVKLHDPRQLRRMFQQSDAVSMTAEWQETLTAMLKDLTLDGDDWRIGAVIHKGGKAGSCWIVGQMVAVHLVDSKATEAMIFEANNAIRICLFDPRSHTGKRHAINVQSMARVDLCDMNEDWRTQVSTVKSNPA